MRTKSLTSNLVQSPPAPATETHPQPAVSKAAAGPRVQRRAALLWLLPLLALNYAGAVAPPVINNITISGGGPRLNIQSDIGVTNRILSLTNLTQTNWTVLMELVVTQSPYSFFDTVGTSAQQRFYRVIALSAANNAPPGMAFIPAGSFQMGDSFNDPIDGNELPVHTVYVSAFYMDKYEVAGGLWNKVQAWNGGNGYIYDGSALAKGTNHPVQTLDWYDMVKWCNARSEMEGRVPAYYTDAALTQVYKTGQAAPYVNWNVGYRLPAEAEWEKAARGGASGHRFPWTDTDTISESQANYFSDSSQSFQSFYDLGPTPGYNSAFNDGVMPYTSPVGSFAPNGYGLYDMAGNVWEWCWDWLADYSSDSQTDPRGPSTGTTRVGRGGNWNYYAVHCRNSYRFGRSPDWSEINIGFRCALSVAQP